MRLPVATLPLALAVLAGSASAQTPWIVYPEGEVDAAAGGAWDRFGASLALSGTTLVAGAEGEDGGGFEAGAAYVWLVGAGGWQLQATLASSDLAAGDRFGAAVAIDGDVIVVGAPADDDLGNASGSAYVFRRQGGVWVEEFKLAASDGAAQDLFGGAVAVSGDTVAVGAIGRDDFGDFSGAVYVYVKSGSAWLEQQKVWASDAGPLRYYGASVALEGDRLVVGADGFARGAYVLDRSGGTWSQQAKLIDPNGTFADRFGAAVDVAGDVVAVGSPLDDDNGEDSGSVQVFRRGPTGWGLQAKLVAGETLGELGRAVALRAGADLLLAGAPRSFALGPVPVGAAHAFALVGADWLPLPRIDAAAPAELDAFGAAVALDGDRFAVGAPDADPHGASSGRVSLFGLLPGPIEYCFGDGSGAVCPCGNASTAGGCANSAGVGARLLPAGIPAFSADSFTLVGADLIAGQPALLFGADNAVGGGAGVPFGDGLRCAGGGVVRLGVRQVDPAGGASWGPGLLAATPWSAGAVRRFQAWYRDPQGGPCGSGFNLSSAVEATLAP